tara:strand:+ start:1079 stop:3331 length:2253 start_codon:yes stop_codon:yes gene_type:complete
MASNQLSPGVVIQERDLTTTAVVPTANVGFLAGPFEQGPVEEIVDIVSETQLVEKFGEPNDYNYEYWFTAANYLSYGGLLKIVRVTHSDLKNACDEGTAPLIKNLDNYEGSFETAANTWTWAARTPGSDGNSIGVFVTDAGADHIAVLPAPGSGNEHEFVEDEALTAASGAAGSVFKYSIVLTVDTVVGTFVPGTSTTIGIGGSAEAVTVLAWDATDKKLEIALPSGGVTGIIADGQTVTQGTNTAVIATSGIERRLYIIKDKGSVDFAATDAVTDTNSTSVVITSVREEYQEREYSPGAKWISVAARPGTSQYADSKGGFRDELHILVIDIDGTITGTPGTLLERFLNVSKASDAKTTVGENNYYPQVIKTKSAYVYWGEHETDVHNANSSASAGNWGIGAENRSFNIIRSAAGGPSYPGQVIAIGSKNNSSYYYRLQNGASYSVTGGFYDISNTDLAKSYDLIADREAVTVDFVLTGPTGNSDVSGLSKINTIKQVIDLRKDCIAFISPRRGHIVGVTDPQVVTDNIVDFFKTLPSSSYMVFDSGYKYVYDKYNDKYRYIPCNSDIAGLCVQTTILTDPWFSPAGFTRGVLRNVIKMGYTPNKAQRDQLYANRVNPIVTFPGQGTVLYGDKTALSFASAFDRINVRRLFLTIERFIEQAAKTQLFEQNDSEQRGFFLNIVEPYMQTVQGRRGVTDFLVKCDDSNNPPEAIDRGEFFAEIYVKPTRTVNYITLSFIATRSGVSFSEVVS